MSDPQTLCECGHVREAHEHYRPGSDCGICGREHCASFRPASEVQAADDGPGAGPAAHSA